MNNEKLSHHDLNAEQAIIAWMEATKEYVDIPEGYLYNDDIKNIYQSWKKQYLENGSFQWNLIPDYLMGTLAECMEIATTAKPEPILKSLRVAHTVREACRVVVGMEKDLCNDVDVIKVLNRASGNITNLLTDTNLKEYNHHESLVEFLVTIDDSRQGRNKFKGVASHLPDLDWLLSGWQRGKVYLISGLEKLGKSRLVRNLFSTWLTNGYGCLMFLLEEDESAVHECIIGCRTKIDTFLYHTNRLSEEQFKQISYEISIYDAQPIHIDIKSSITPQYIKSMVQKKKIEFSKKGVELTFVAIDYIQRMSNEGETKHEQTENTAAQLANIARDENICLLEVSQLASGAEKNKNIPLHTQIRFGKVFKEAASTIITLDDPNRSKGEGDMTENDFSTIRAHIIQRKGKSNITVDLCAELQYSLFTNFRKNKPVEEAF